MLFRSGDLLEPDQGEVVGLALRIEAGMEDDARDPDLRRLRHVLQPAGADLGPEIGLRDAAAPWRAEAMRRGQDPLRRDEGAGAEIDPGIAGAPRQGGDIGIAERVGGERLGSGGAGKDERGDGEGEPRFISSC